MDQAKPCAQPPMNMQALVEGQSLGRELIKQIEHLLALKSEAKEIGRGARIPMIDAFIHNQITWAEVVAKQVERPDLMAEADALLRQIVKREV